MALLRNLCVNLQDFLCGVFQHASAQSLDILDLAQDCSFMNWKLELRHSEAVFSDVILRSKATKNLMVKGGSRDSSLRSVRHWVVSGWKLASKR
jgi:hypothetical protein